MSGQPPQCPNCGGPAEGRYCPDCGQDQNDPRGSVIGWLQTLVEEELSVDGRLFRSFSKLVAHPGALTVEWIEGKRNRSVSPLRAYLVASVFFFTVSFLFGLPLTGRQLDVGLPDLGSYTRLSDVIDDAVAGRGQVLLTASMLALVPLYSLWLWAIHPKRTGALVDHLVFSLHEHAAILVLLGLIWPLMFVVSPWWWLAIMSAAAAHAFVGYWRVYRGQRRVLRTIASAGGWGAIVVAMLVGIGGPVTDLLLSANWARQRDHAATLYRFSHSEAAQADTAAMGAFRRAAFSVFLNMERADGAFLVGRDTVHFAELLVDHRFDPGLDFDEPDLTARADALIGKLLLDHPEDYTVRGIAMDFAMQQGDTVGARGHAQVLMRLEAPTGYQARRAETYRRTAEALGDSGSPR